ncbi:AAA family ATPase [Paenibacillus chitinolyticus]
MKDIYLPILRSISIKNYSLYVQEPTFKFYFLDGISAIIGGNGIGKTTFVEIILYCLLGHRRIYPVLGKKKTKTKEKIIDSKFFSSRMNPKYGENPKAEACLEFTLGGNEIIINRSLYLNQIISLKINEEETILFDEDFYRQQITQFSGINSFQMFDNIIRKFLFFDEKRENIAWDIDLQDEILKTLFFDEEFLHKFRELEEEVIYEDTRGRHKSEDRRLEKESLENLKQEKEKLFTEVKKDGESIDLIQLYERKVEIETEILDVKNELDDKLDLFNIEQERLDNALGEKNTSMQKIEELNTDINKLEAKLYASLYNQLPEYYLSLERFLISEGRCLACGTKNKDLKAIATQHKQDGECIICSSKLQDLEAFDPEIVDKINIFVDQRNELQIIVTNKDLEITTLQITVNIINNDVNNIKNKLNDLQREVLYIDSAAAQYNSKNSSDTYTQIVEVKQKNIDKLTNEITEIYKKRDELKDELNKLHNKFNKVVIGLNKHLSYFFNKYASTFIGLECELTVQNKTINKIPHVTYLPKINGSIREGVNSVSESQRFFLDQAFRMAIIDYLQNTIKDFKTFFITETPEGSLDIVYEKQVAEMFTLFARSLNNIIFTSNLNSSNFLLTIYKEINVKEREVRTLNLLEKGNQTRLQQNNPQLKDLSKRIMESDGT